MCPSPYKIFYSWSLDHRHHVRQWFTAFTFKAYWIVRKIFLGYRRILIATFLVFNLKIYIFAHENKGVVMDQPSNSRLIFIVLVFIDSFWVFDEIHWNVPNFPYFVDNFHLLHKEWPSTDLNEDLGNRNVAPPPRGFRLRNLWRTT